MSLAPMTGKRWQCTTSFSRSCSEFMARPLPYQPRERSPRRIERLGEEGALDGSPFLDADGTPSFLEYARTPGEAIERGRRSVDAAGTNEIGDEIFKQTARAQTPNTSLRLRLLQAAPLYRDAFATPPPRLGCARISQRGVSCTSYLRGCGP